MAKKAAHKKTIQSTPKHQNHSPVPRGSLLIIGGAENKGEKAPEEKRKPQNFIRLEILRAFADLIGKKNPQIALITTAGSEPGETLKEYRKAFNEVGITKIWQVHHKERKELLADEELLSSIPRINGFFFTGGDQLKLTSMYGGTAFLSLLKERYIREKIVVGGTSAGAMALSTPMIYAGNESVQQLGGEIKVTTGLEFIKDVCIDTHFVHRGRFVRMAQVVVTNPTCIGIGIEEDTAIIVRNGVDVEVVGNGSVIIIEGFAIAQANIDDFSEDRPVTIRNLRVHLLSSGDKYEIMQVNPPHK